MVLRTLGVRRVRSSIPEWTALPLVPYTRLMEYACSPDDGFEDDEDERCPCVVLIRWPRPPVVKLFQLK